MVLEPGADQAGDAIKILRLLVPQNADGPTLLRQDVLEAAESRVLCGPRHEVRAELIEQHRVDRQAERHIDD